MEPDIQGRVTYRMEVRAPQNILVYSIDSGLPLPVPPAGSILSFGNARERVICGQQHWHFTPTGLVIITVFVQPMKEQA